MSLEGFQLLDIEPIDNSIIKRVFTKIYHRQEINQINQIKILNLFFVKITIIVKLAMLI